jgi:hypothetical protein
MVTLLFATVVFLSGGRENIRLVNGCWDVGFAGMVKSGSRCLMDVCGY